LGSESSNGRDPKTHSNCNRAEFHNPLYADAIQVVPDGRSAQAGWWKNAPEVVLAVAVKLATGDFAGFRDSV
jgi:hypothetical protein